MRFLFALILGLPFMSSSAEVIKTGQTKIGLYRRGQPPTLGYWSVDTEGRFDTLIAPYHKDLKVYQEGGTFKLVRRVSREFAKGDTPLPGLPTRMTETSCGALDLADQMGPVREQVAGSCYGFAAMELLNFGIKERYSALHLVQMMENGPSKTALKKAETDILRLVRGFNSSYTTVALKLAMKVGLCPESVVPDKEYILAENYQRLLQYYQKIDEQKKTLQEDCDADMSAEESNIKKIAILLKSKIQQSKLWDTNEVEGEIKRIFPSLEPSYVKEIWLKAENANDFMQGLVKNACTGHIKKNIPPGKTEKDIRTEKNIYTHNDKMTYYEEDRPMLLDSINASLDKGRPIVISFLTGGLIQSVGEPGHRRHSSVVNGRKWLAEEIDSDGQIIRPAGCYYLVKNSWGSDWKVPEGYKAKPSALHPGHFVLSEKHLMEHLYGTTWID